MEQIRQVYEMFRRLLNSFHQRPPLVNIINIQQINSTVVFGMDGGKFFIIYILSLIIIINIQISF